jgi:nucleoside-diphosphate-sugar epimerase
VRVLVTGHRGYLGTALVPVFLDAGHDVVGLDTGLFRDCGFGSPPTAVPSIDVDVRDIGPPDLRGFDAVVHLAGISNDPLADLDPERTYEINFRATVRLAEAAKEAGVRRFLFSSSCSLYGAQGDAPIDETTQFRPVTPYGESKALSERALHGLASDDFSPTYMRSATAYGVSPMVRGDLVVNNLTGLAATTGEVLMSSDGTPWRPLVHVCDVARAFLAVVEAPRDLVHDEPFNVGATGENYQIRDVAAIVEAVVPGSVIRFADGAGPDRRNYRVDCDKLARVLPRAVPQWTVDAGVKELYDAFCRYGLTHEQLNGRLLRIARVKELLAAGRIDTRLRWVDEEQ